MSQDNIDHDQFFNICFGYCGFHYRSSETWSLIRQPSQWCTASNFFRCYHYYGKLFSFIFHPDMSYKTETLNIDILFHFQSVIGLIGAIREHFYLVLSYGLFILGTFVLRIAWSITSYWHKGEYFILDATAGCTIMTVIFSLLLAIFSFLFAHAIRIESPESPTKKATKKGKKKSSNHHTHTSSKSSSSKNSAQTSPKMKSNIKDNLI